VNVKTGELHYGCLHSWHCPRGKWHQIFSWEDKLKGIEFDCHITITTRLCYTSADNVEKAHKIKKAFLSALRYQFGGEYFWVMGVGHGNRIHFHILFRGARVKKKWARGKLFEIARCYMVDVTDYDPHQLRYLLRDNAGEIPDAYSVTSFSSLNIWRLRFHRVGTSRSHIFKAPKTPAPKSDYKFLDVVSPDGAGDGLDAERLKEAAMRVFSQSDDQVRWMWS